MSTFAPTWELRINGKRFPSGLKPMVREVRVEATTDGADQLVIEADAYDSVGRQYRIGGQDVLGPGNSVVVRMGYVDGGGVSALQRFRIVREEPHYPAAGHPWVRFVGYSAEHRLVEVTKARTYPSSISDSEIVRELAEEVGLRTTADSLRATPARTGRSRIKPKGTTDWSFLQSLAALNDYGPPTVRYSEALDADVLYFRPTALADQPDRFRFLYDVRTDRTAEVGHLRSFDAQISIAGVPTSVRVTGWDPATQAAVTVEVELTGDAQGRVIYEGAAPKNVTAPRSGSGLQVEVLSTAPDVGEGSKDERLYVGTVDTTESAASFARRWIATRNRAYATARATVTGDPRIWIGQVHTFDGLAPAHTGLWEVVRAVHRMQTGSGYVVDLDLVRVLEETPEER